MTETAIRQPRRVTRPEARILQPIAAPPLLRYFDACERADRWGRSTIRAWLFLFGACFAWYTGAMVLLEYSWGRVVLPFGVIPGLMKLPAAANVPGTRLAAPVEYALGQPGTRHAP